ncbi:MAG: FeoB small GTPase domain-containing protein [Pyrinomonadaceae bacterium]
MLQVLEITDRAVVALNLIDEARSNGLKVDERSLSRELGVPVVPMAARRGEGISDLLSAVDNVAQGAYPTRRRQIKFEDSALELAVSKLATQLENAFNYLPNARWGALRLLEGDESIIGAVNEGTIGRVKSRRPFRAVLRNWRRVREMAATPESILHTASSLRQELGHHLHDKLAEAIYSDAGRIADRVVTRGEPARIKIDQFFDRVLTSRLWGFPLMILILTFVFWLTVAGANVPSAMLASLLQGTVYDALHDVARSINTPWWLSGLLIDGVYLATAWVISVMLPLWRFSFRSLRCLKI